MLVCIPTNGNAGAEDTVCDHFGSAAYFTLYDTSTDELKVINNRNAHHSHGTCHPMNQLAKYRPDCIVCAGMGRRAIEALSTEGIKVYISESEKVADIIDEIKAGKMTEIDPARACRGHGQQAGMGHGFFQSGQGRGSGFGQGGCRGSGQGSRGGRHRNQD